MEYIYTAPSLSHEICDRIIQQYEESSIKYEGVTLSGLDKNIKDTCDLSIPENWDEINQGLIVELEKHMNIYIKLIESGANYRKDNNYGNEFHHFHEYTQQHPFIIQRYEKNIGKYVYHDDSKVEQTKTRTITYIWYLNDVIEGGETEFFGGSFKVRPEKGKLLLFPALWCYPHRGNIPISSNKYIVTGWLYTENKIAMNLPPKIVDVIKETPMSTEIRRIFDHYYLKNKDLFLHYKKGSFFRSFTFMTYTRFMLTWIHSKISSLTERTSIDSISDLLPWMRSSLEMLIEHVKEVYSIDCQVNIKEWYVVYNETHPFDISYDLCIQTDLSTGESYVSSQYKDSIGYQFVYFIEFIFHYRDKDDQTKMITLKELSDSFLDVI